jgi:chemotaxis protein histidine kinase CheA
MPELTNNPELVKVFKDETQHLIDTMRDELSRLKENTDTHTQSKVYWKLYLCTHTLKGSSGCAGFQELGEINKVLEDIFRSAKDGKFEIKADSIPLLSEGIEVCQKLLNEEEVIEYHQLLERLRRFNHDNCRNET